MGADRHPFAVGMRIGGEQADHVLRGDAAALLAAIRPEAKGEGERFVPPAAARDSTVSVRPACWRMDWNAAC
jgi:hypothetical protein